MSIDAATLKPGVNLDNCAKEPIHLSGAVQPHGLLFAVSEPDLAVTMVSANAGMLLGLSPEQALGMSLSAIFEETSTAKLQAATKAPSLMAVNPLLLTTTVAFGRRTFDAVLHRASGLLVVELEPVTSSESSRLRSFYHTSQQVLARLQTARDISELVTIAAHEIRELSGFDRVMVYRFAPDWHGEVVSESKRHDLDPYLGLHYPASDIPAQARRLYVANRLRLIADVPYQAAPLITAADHLGAGALRADELDLSFSVLRSVSPMHVQYLTNMGVRASMSISLLRNGTELWGLVACHHYAPHFVPYETRMACEFLGQNLSWQISARAHAHEVEMRSHHAALLSRVTGEVGTAESITKALTQNPETMLELCEAGGLAALFDGKLTLIGATPPAEAVTQLCRWLTTYIPDAIYSTQQLRTDYPAAATFAEVGSGLLAVRLTDTAPHDYLLWFRPERITAVNWAGAPQVNASYLDTDKRLSPRGSFALWRETVRETSTPWESWTIASATAVAAAIEKNLAQRARQLEVVNNQLLAAAIAKDEFLAVVSHELRTPLNAIIGWVRLLEDGDVTPDEMPEAIGTIGRSAASQQRLIEDLLDLSRIVSGKLRLDVQSISPSDFVTAALENVRPAAAAKGVRLQVVLDPHAGIVAGDAPRLQQVAWNLLSNAIKFTPKGGRVHVTLCRVESSVVLTVQDNGEGIDAQLLPHIFERFKQGEMHVARRHQGLGLGLAIVKNLAELHGGKVTATSQGLGHGSAFSLQLPLVPVHVGDKQTAAVKRPPLPSPPELIGLKVLVVDDDDDARRILSRSLLRCQSEVVAVRSANDAIATLATFRPDVVISDIGMPETDGYQLITRIRALADPYISRIPAIALTAFARSEDRTRALNAGFQAHLSKPIAPAELYAVLASVAGRNMSRGAP